MTPTDLAAAKRAAQSLIWQEDDPDDAKAVLVARAFAALLEERNAVLAERQWRPIETAPKDGTMIMLGHPDFPAEAGWWEYGSWFQGWCCGGHRSDMYGPSFEPTHWQPVVAPPEGGRHE